MEERDGKNDKKRIDICRGGSFFLLFTVQIISGYVMTMLYVPDIISTYESVEVHHRTVSFGTAVKVPGWLI